MDRPDPDELLDRIQRDEEKRQRGRLKIFFGASAGVGKTYAMLAGRARASATKASTWWSASSRRTAAPRPLALLDGLEVLPLRAHRVPRHARSPSSISTPRSRASRS